MIASFRTYGKEIASHSAFMSIARVSRRLLCFGGAASLLTRGARPRVDPVYLFETADTRIRMTLEYHDRFEQNRLRFRDALTGRSFCAMPNERPDLRCSQSFHGSLAIVHYQLAGLRSAWFPTRLRELVRDVDRSEAVSARLPFERAIELQNGAGSDIQAFGLEGSAGDRSSFQSIEDDPAWFVLRQDLYLGSAAVPFLVLHWRHQMKAIRVLDLLPGPGTRQIFEPSRS